MVLKQFSSRVEMCLNLDISFNAKRKKKKKGTIWVQIKKRKKNKQSNSAALFFYLFIKNLTILISSWTKYFSFLMILMVYFLFLMTGCLSTKAREPSLLYSCIKI